MLEMNTQSEQKFGYPTYLSRIKWNANTELSQSVCGTV